ncbi:hypothetical protein QBC43DRAFT_197574 [Cladorrhinum sp. PSN259]|nr:hypothetical protein QBC43DRAFT_197574 [Cladorrhinum sp. PSN259]
MQSTDPPTSPLTTTPSVTDPLPITETSTPLSTATSSPPTSSSPTSSQASTSQTATSLQSSQSDSTSPASTSPTLMAQTSTSSAATPSASPNSSSSDPLTSYWPEQPWHISTTVKGNHVPLIIGRGTVFLLSAMYNQLITHDPVRQLSSVGGISGPDLLGGGSYSSHIGMFAAQLGTIFAAGGTFLDTSHCTTDDETNCDPKLSGTPWVLDIVICVLVIQAGVIVYAASKWFQKPGRLSADPTTIAGVVVVMGHPEVERLFGGFPGELSEGELRERLREHRFKLGMFETSEGVEKYGIVPVPITERKEQSKFGKVREALGKLVFWRDWKLNRLVVDLLFASLLVGLLGLTLACIASVDRPRRIFATAAPTGTKGGVGMKILFAFVGVIITSNWGRLFQDTQTFTPYFPLRDGGAQPNPTILLSRHTSPLCAFLPLLRNRHLAAASVAFTGLISEFLIIALAGLPYRAGQLRSEFLFCGIVSVVVLSIMLAQLVLVMIWRRRLPHLPRRPDTIAAVMTYVADTSMVKDFRGLEEMSTKDRNRAIIEMGKVYAYGWRQEPEGRGIRWLVDEVQDSEKKSFLSEGRPSAEPGQDPGPSGYYGRPEGYHSGYGRDV